MMALLSLLITETGVVLFLLLVNNPRVAGVALLTSFACGAWCHWREDQRLAGAVLLAVGVALGTFLIYSGTLVARQLQAPSTR